MPRIHPKSSKVSSALDVMMLLPKNPSFDKKRTHSLLQQKSLSENHLQCILSYFTSPTLKRKSLQRRIEVTPASELCMQVHYFLWWWQAGVIKRGEKLGRPLQQILFGSWYHNHDDEGQVVIISCRVEYSPS